MPRINYASTMMVEDHLKTMMTLSQGPKFWRSYHNQLLPKSQHSVFGDFPKDMMPKRTYTAFSPAPEKSSKMAGITSCQEDERLSPTEYENSPIKYGSLSPVKRSRKYTLILEAQFI